MGERNKLEPTAFSNDIRLTCRQWLGVGLFAALLVDHYLPTTQTLSP